MTNSHDNQEINTTISTCRRRRSVLSALFLAGLLQITNGCAAARLTQFHNFAQAGTALHKGEPSRSR